MSNSSPGSSRIWRLAAPLILSNISIAILGIVDTAVVGHLDEPHYLGAVAVAAVIFNFLYWSMGFLRMGTTGIVAQVHGKIDNNGIRVALAQPLILAIVIAICLLSAQLPIAQFGLSMMGGSQEVLYFARQYFDIAIWGAPAVLISMVLSGWLLGMQNARATLYFAVTVNLVNIVLDLLFVLVFDMKVEGVALASVIAQFSGLFLGIYLVKKELLHYPGKWLLSALVKATGLLQLLNLNRDIFIRTICLIFVFAFFTRQGAQQGDVILAANALLLNFQALLALGLDGFANACEALVGKAIGAKDRAAFRESVRLAMFWSIIIACVFTGFYWLNGEWLISVMTDLPEVYSAAVTYLPWLIISPLICVWCFLLDGIYIGALRGKEMRNSMLVSTFLIFLPFWFILNTYENHGLWLAFLCFFIARGATLGWSYYQIEFLSEGFVVTRKDHE